MRGLCCFGNWENEISKGFAPPLHIVHLPPASAAEPEAGRRRRRRRRGRRGRGPGRRRRRQLEQPQSPVRGHPALSTLLYSRTHSSILFIFHFPCCLRSPELSWCLVRSVMWQQQQQHQHLQQQQHGDPVACSRARPKRESNCPITGLYVQKSKLEEMWYL